MEARYCKDTEVVIIGGGNSAGQAAMFLSRYARRVVCGTGFLAGRFDVELSHQPSSSRSGITIEYNREVTALRVASIWKASPSAMPRPGSRRRLRRERYLSWSVPHQTPSGSPGW